MSHFILLPATGGDSDGPVFATGLAVARLLDGHLAFLHVRPDVQHEVASFAAAGFGMATGIEAVVATLEQEAGARERAAEQAWHAFCVRERVAPVDLPGTDGVSAEWLTETGSLPGWLAAHGRTADLLVVGRGGDDGVVAIDVMESALMDTGRPVLIASDAPRRPLDDLVAIAWKDTPEAAGAVAAAGPFIRKARRVIVFFVEEPNHQPDGSARRLLHSLRWHNPNVGLQRLERDDRPPVEVLLDVAARAGAGLLVMGGYGHNRVREAVFGGFTRAVLEHAPLPVLMAH